VSANLAQEIAFVAGLSIKAAAVFGVGAVLMLAMRRASASLRHQAGTLIIWSAAALPIAAFLLPAFELPVLPERASSFAPASSAVMPIVPAFQPVIDSANTNERIDQGVDGTRKPVLRVRKGTAKIAAELESVRGSFSPEITVDSAWVHSTSGLHLVARLRRALKSLAVPLTLAVLLALGAGMV
jgi:hypothetical protein